MEKRLNKILIEVVYASNNNQAIIPIELKQGSTVLQAIEASGILKIFPEMDTLDGQVGIFGKVVPLDTALKEGDRVEIYRLLIRDPKEARRVRAKSLQRARAKK